MFTNDEIMLIQCISPKGGLTFPVACHSLRGKLTGVDIELMRMQLDRIHRKRGFEYEVSFKLLVNSRKDAGESLFLPEIHVKRIDNYDHGGIDECSNDTDNFYGAWTDMGRAGDFYELLNEAGLENLNKL